MQAAKPHSASARRALCWVTAALLCLASFAAASDDPLAVQRALFARAEKALSQKQYKRFKRFTQRLRGYPLHPYLVFADLRQRLGSAPTSDIEGFLERYAATPLAPRLRAAWLLQLGKRKRWRTFLQHYRDGINDKRLQCLRLQGLLDRGMDAAFAAAIETQWHSGRSQPRECDTVFSAWRKRGGLTSEKAWQRHALAMKARNLRLARYLLRFMNGADRKLAKTWQRLYRRPQSIVDFKLGPKSQTQRRLIATQVLLRLTDRDPEAAAKLMQHPIVHRLDPADREQLYQRLALAFAYLHRAEALAWARKVATPPVDEHFAGWRIASALRQQRWQQALGWINELPAEHKSSERWRYWRAYLLERAGATEAANAVYRDLAKTRSYYGFLAADQQKLDYRFQDQPTQVGDHVRRAFAQQDAVIRARELWYFDDHQLDARREWRDATRDADNQTLTAAALTAQQWGWHDIAIATIARTGQFNDIALRFPLAYRETVTREARRYDVSEALILATMRQESAFRSDALSSARAIGLMQIIPRTGRYIAKKLGLRWRGNGTLYRPQTNLRYGAFYLAHLRSRVTDNLVLASAAYNAGLRQVKRWLPQNGQVAAMIWIENIPYSETRKYVRNILEFVVVYEHRLGRPYKRLSERLKPIVAAID